MKQAPDRAFSNPPGPSLTSSSSFNQDEWVSAQVSAFRIAAEGNISQSVRSLSTQLEAEFQRRLSEAMREAMKRGDVYKETALNNSRLADTLRTENLRLKAELGRYKQQTECSSKMTSMALSRNMDAMASGDSKQPDTSTTLLDSRNLSDYHTLVSNYNALVANHQTLEVAFANLGRKFKEAKLSVQLWRDYFEKKHKNCCADGVEVMKGARAAASSGIESGLVTPHRIVPEYSARSPRIESGTGLTMTPVSDRPMKVGNRSFPPPLTSVASFDVSDLPANTSRVVISALPSNPGEAEPMTPATALRERPQIPDTPDDQKSQSNFPSGLEAEDNLEANTASGGTRFHSRTSFDEDRAHGNGVDTIPSSQATEGEAFIPDRDDESSLLQSSPSHVKVKVKPEISSQNHSIGPVSGTRGRLRPHRTETLDLDLSSQLITNNEPGPAPNLKSHSRKRRRVGPASSPPPVPEVLRFGEENNIQGKYPPNRSFPISVRTGDTLTPARSERAASSPPEHPFEGDDQPVHLLPICLMRTNSAAGSSGRECNTDSGQSGKTVLSPRSLATPTPAPPNDENLRLSSKTALRLSGRTPRRIGVLHPLGVNRRLGNSPQTPSPDFDRVPVPTTRSTVPSSGVRRLRDLPPSVLKLSDFRINPAANDGFRHAYAETTRGHARKSMRGCVDPRCCGKEFKALAEAADDGVFDRLLSERSGSRGQRARPASSPSHITIKAGDGSKVHLSFTEWRLVGWYLGLENDYAAMHIEGPSDPFDPDAPTTGSTYSISSHVASLPDPAAVEDFVMAAKVSILADTHGRQHRDRFRRRAKTPAGFWDTDFPDTQETARRRVEQEEERADWEREEVEMRAAEARRGGGLWVFRDEFVADPPHVMMSWE